MLQLLGYCGALPEEVQWQVLNAKAAAVGFGPTDRVFPAKVRPDQAIISRPH